MNRPKTAIVGALALTVAAGLWVATATGGHPRQITFHDVVLPSSSTTTTTG